MLETPVAFIVFNRPDLTLRTFEPIRRARPKVLCIISDAARGGRTGEAALIAQSRQIAENVDWPCQVERYYSNTNLGCRRRVSSGLSEIFERYEQAIVIEDDCEVSDSFFTYCDSLLNHYADDQRVMAISGDNFQSGRRYGDGSYYFSKYPHCWGWASWRRAWRHYEPTMNAWPSFRDRGDLMAFCDSIPELDYWTRIFDRVHQEQIDSWAYIWNLACWMNHGLTALPNQNLVSNIGFGEDATHTSGQSPLENLPRFELESIKHPSHVARSCLADQRSDRELFSRGKTKPRHVVQYARRWFTGSAQVA
ncbi:hypothetical protein CA13_43300 [Planctomycetes bacterium CA13]|uniref:GNT-I family protein n=1 Tax=Novipirellula herctigrandis TaxID=2527986 RepID=A0A5C5Z723_9BACT|nr:hypothetical protein CA13_43300 [Planctomycetes bacterium CA13]